MSATMVMKNDDRDVGGVLGGEVKPNHGNTSAIHDRSIHTNSGMVNNIHNDGDNHNANINTNTHTDANVDANINGNGASNANVSDKANKDKDKDKVKAKDKTMANNEYAKHKEVPMQQGYGGKLEGAFAGYVRRPKPSIHGMTSQFFGENGQSADTILALSLTKFQDREVGVKVYLVKDPNGMLMKQEDGLYPLLTYFNGFIQRSMAQKDGMTAQIFAQNGVNADALSETSKTEYQDALVYIEIMSEPLDELAILDQVGTLGYMRAMNKKEGNVVCIQTPSYAANVTKHIDELYKDTIPLSQHKQLEKAQNKSKKLWEKLKKSGFFKNDYVVGKIASQEAFKTYLSKFGSLHYKENSADEEGAKEYSCADENNNADVTDNSTKSEDVHVYKVGFINGEYNYYPLSEEKYNELCNNVLLLEEHIDYYREKHGNILSKWAMKLLNEKISEHKDYLASEEALRNWIKENRLEIFAQN